MSQSPKTKAKLLREPPPSLFLGPRSQNASHVSLPGVPAAPPATNPSSSLNPSRAPLIRQRSQRMPVTGSGRSTLDGPAGVTVDTSIPPAIPRPSLPRQTQDSENKRQADRTDALWAEMQSTLEEVELSAVNGTHVFGPEHSKALEGLRAAQIELAQAWAKSESDDAVETADRESKGLSGAGAGKSALGSDVKSVLEATMAGSTVPSGGGSVRPGSSGNPAVGAAHVVGDQLEDVEADIVLARRRREANDKYFQRVNEGVLDVVAKLEEVANAMRAVEQESRDIWGESESARTSIHE